SYWNAFERRLTRDNGRYFVNGTHELVFYHFSGYRAENPEAVTRTGPNTLVTFSERPDLRPLYDDYRNRLLARDYASVKALPFFGRPRATSKFHLKTALKNSIRTVLRTLPVSCQTSAKKLAQFTVNCLVEEL